MATPIVSIVMSVFNGERFLREAVDSILDQTFAEFEFIIVDDGSTDASASILDSYRNSDGRVKVHHPGHAGLSEALNRGCRLAQGKYIARMDADDVSLPDRLMRQVDLMEAHPEIGILGGAVEWIDATGKSLAVYRHPTEDGQIKAALLDHCAFWHPTVLFRREVFAWTGGYRGVTLEASDYDMWLRIAEHFQLANLDDVVLKYRIHPSQVSMSKNLQQTLCILAAQVAATSRRTGGPDLLNGLEEITPEVLAGWGVTKAMQQRELTSNRHRWIQHMCRAGEYSVALEAALQTLQSDLDYAERRRIADLYLTVALLYWKQRKFAKSCFAAAHAVVTRPVVAGRPFKMLLQQLVRA